MASTDDGLPAEEGDHVDWFARSKWICGVVCIAMVLTVGACGSSSSSPPPLPDPEPGEVIGTSPEPSEDLEEIALRVGEILDLGYLAWQPTDVMKRLTGLSGDPLFVLDTREPDDFDAGHIPGAINIPLQDLPRALLEGTSGIPMDTDVVVASYFGGDGIFAATLINTYRIEDPSNAAAYKQARGLYCGMTTWSFDRDLVPEDTRFDDALVGGVRVEEGVQAGINDGTDQGAFPVFEPFETDPVIEKILVRAEHWLNSVSDQRALTLYPSTLRDDPNDFQVISVRGATHYEAGHIPAAINIPWKMSADLENYTKFAEPDGTLAVYCYTGHSGAAATVALGILGYDARNIVFGMNGWSTTAPASGQLRNFDLNRGWDFPLHTRDGGIDDLDGWKPNATGCEACHTDLTAVWMDREIDVPPGDTLPPSSGEG